MIDVKGEMLKAIEEYERNTWKIVPGFSRYEVNLFGDLRNKKQKIILSRKISSRGYYMQQAIGDDNKYHALSLHRAVALAFIPNPNNYPQVHHKDENPLNPYYKNLQWCTQSQNMRFNGLNKRMKERQLKQKGKIVYLYDLEGNFLKEQLGVNDLANEIQGCKGIFATICKHNSNNPDFLRSYKGYIPSYSKLAKEEIQRKRDKTIITNGHVNKPTLPDGNYKGLKKKKKVYQYDLNGNYINSYESLGEACRCVGIKSSSELSGCCIRQRPKTCHGYKWSFNPPL